MNMCRFPETSFVSLLKENHLGSILAGKRFCGARQSGELYLSSK